MIRLCTAVSFPVCAWSENWGSAWIKTNKQVEIKSKYCYLPWNWHIFGHISIMQQHRKTLLHKRWTASQNFVLWLLWHDISMSRSLPHCSVEANLSIATNKQPNETENLIPALHFSQFWFMTCCCLFPQPKSFQPSDWFSPESLFVCCWQPPVCVSTAVLVSTGNRTRTHKQTHNRKSGYMYTQQ